MDYLSKIKSSQPARTRTPTYGDSIALESTDIDTENELEFELDADWMASMLSDDFVRTEVQYDHQDTAGLLTTSKAGSNRLVQQVEVHMSK
ncbi:hypothetical protein BGZ75_007728 [Mortierella antarctica]|nr:hypothetical protein BGZ75_007728 [Mortierella antarctica]